MRVSLGALTAPVSAADTPCPDALLGAPLLRGPPQCALGPIDTPSLTENTCSCAHMRQRTAGHSGRARARMAVDELMDSGGWPTHGLGRCRQLARPPVICLRWGLPHVWGRGGNEGNKEFVYVKWASHCWLSIQDFFFHERKHFLGLGRWVHREAMLPPPPSAPPPPIRWSANEGRPQRRYGTGFGVRMRRPLCVLWLQVVQVQLHGPRILRDVLVLRLRGHCGPGHRPGGPGHGPAPHRRRTPPPDSCGSRRVHKWAIPQVYPIAL